MNGVFWTHDFQLVFHFLMQTWLPYKGQSSNARSEKGRALDILTLLSNAWFLSSNTLIYCLLFHYMGADKNLYTIRAVPFSDIRSIRRHTPTLGWQYIIVVMSSGNHSFEIVISNMFNFIMFL